ncbi:multiple monosaccharide ABC transporter ATP-binding protein [Lederbergia galactosidilytica]|uniref:ABC transporter ATP-binding protein n=1 Tax=Lederbergia galactosidilytica TaxID=217031 RepID=A0A177ZGZ2_9BACI|nr:multiple monosaccharide ABC transporter ATP-binding protein [Lederbergia galactosidilytica]MBP1915782.1 putative multiple sugar transport system ATP-binding protein [Lederbergia galactosidilytica]OAK67192.1 ABC transporter ATP-binding protein [Lederbergia galactosidilytica]
MKPILLEMKDISKEFPGVKALDRVNFQVQEGEIHALCGENGAGKSTLMKVLSGVYPYGSYDGNIFFKNEECNFKDIRQSEELGIVIIHQELALIPELSIAENIFLGNEQAVKGVINWNETKKRTKELLKVVGLKESPDTFIKNIGVGKQQLIEIAKALSKDVRLLILDEPTAALNESDSINLLNLLKELQTKGITSIIISHKLNEIKQVADKATIIRDGRTIETINTAEITEDRIIHGMVGRSLSNRYPERTPNIGKTFFEVKGWTVDHPVQKDRQVVKDIHFHIRRGEIVGVAGLMGAGRTELAMSLFGQSYGKKTSGDVLKGGQLIDVSTVPKAIEAGMAYVSEDRKTYGLILMNDIKENISLSKLEKISKRQVVDQYEEYEQADSFRRTMNIKTPSVTQKTGNLSGGNQQKVVLSKWIFSEPELLILDEPTRGIDVGAKYEIYTIIHHLANEGKGILMISSELPEILGICDRIYVMSEGEFTGEVTKTEATQELLMKYMTNSKGDAE